MKWDGSYLGDFSHKVIEEFRQITRRMFEVKIALNKKRYKCILHREGRSKNYFNLVDEMKSVFGLEKVGTHTLTLDVSILDGKVSRRKTRYILMRSFYTEINRLPSINSPVFAAENSPSDWRKQLKDQINLHLAFRKLVLVKKTASENIRVRLYDDGLYRTFCGDHFTTTLFSDNKYNLDFLKTKSDSSWNSYIGQDNALKDLLKYKSVDSITEELEQIIDRIDSSYFGLIDIIFTRLSYL